MGFDSTSRRSSFPNHMNQPIPSDADTARQLYPGEVIPSWLNTGFERARLNSAWIWCIGEFNRARVVLIGAPAHNMVIFLRLCAKPGIASSDLLKVLRWALKDCHRRGHEVYMVGIDNNDPAAAALISIITRAGGRIFAQQTVYAGSTDVSR